MSAKRSVSFKVIKERNRNRQKNFDSYKLLKTARTEGRKQFAEFILYYGPAKNTCRFGMHREHSNIGYVKIVATSVDDDAIHGTDAVFWNKYRNSFDFGQQRHAYIYTGSPKGSKRYRYQKETFPVVELYHMREGKWVKDDTL